MGHKLRELRKVFLWSILIAFVGLAFMNCRNTREVTFEELRNPDEVGIDTLLGLFVNKYREYITSHSDTTLFPRCYDNDSAIMVPPGDWTSGFFPGILWNLYDFSGDDLFLYAAQSWTNTLKEECHNTSTHDVGFVINSSFGQAFRITRDESYREVLDTAAQSLASRYDDNLKCIKSLDENEYYKYPVLIDNMVNLEILYKAWQWNEDPRYYRIANDHALNTMEMHFRPDFSAFQVVDFDPGTSLPRYKGSFQGYSDSSAWARGQSWGLYGFVLAFRETRDRIFLDQSLRIATYILEHENFPEDGIPYWDFNAPDIPAAPRDATSAVILASALIELSSYEEVKQPEKYLDVAENIIYSLLTRDYIAGEHEYENFVLKHGVGSIPGDSEVNVALIYGDYYLLEALMKYKNLKIDDKN